VKKRKFIGYFALSEFEEKGIKDPALIRQVLEAEDMTVKTFIGAGYAEPSVYAYRSDDLQGWLNTLPNKSICTDMGWPTQAPDFAKCVAEISLEEQTMDLQQELTALYLNHPENKNFLEQHGINVERTDNPDLDWSITSDFVDLACEKIDSLRVELNELRRKTSIADRVDRNNLNRQRELEKLCDLLGLGADWFEGDDSSFWKALGVMEKMDFTMMGRKNNDVLKQMENWASMLRLEWLIAASFNNKDFNYRLTDAPDRNFPAFLQKIGRSQP
jgi:hypothetical protein